MSVLVGKQAPDFTAPAVLGDGTIVDNYEFSKETKGKYVAVVFYPLDFTFVCPTEIAEFNNKSSDFADRDAVLIGASTDSEFVHAAWRRDHTDLRDLKFPMLADTSKSLAEELGILADGEKVAYRATFIVDPQGIIRWVSVYDLSVGRSVGEVLRVLDALQTDELCPCNWTNGQETLTAQLAAN